MQFTTNNVMHRNILLFLRVFFADGGENWRERKNVIKGKWEQSWEIKKCWCRVVQSNQMGK